MGRFSSRQTKKILPDKHAFIPDLLNCQRLFAADLPGGGGK
jgi:hypothetical protein